MRNTKHPLPILSLFVGLVAVGCSSLPWSKPEPAPTPTRTDPVAKRASPSAQKKSGASRVDPKPRGEPPKTVEATPTAEAQITKTGGPAAVQVAAGSKDSQHDANDDGSMVPDCDGGKTRAPAWLIRIPFWAALCVHAPAKKDLKIDIGTNLLAHGGLADGSAITENQVYYSLSQVAVAAGQKKVVWAVCGGAGDWLWNGSRVVPGHRLPAPSAKKLAAQVSALITLATEAEFLDGMLPNATPEQAVTIRGKLRVLDDALTDAAGLLRDALIQENRVLLTKSGRPRGPLWY